MTSVSGRTAEEYSAKKKARQEKWWIFPVVLLLCVLFCAAGAALIWYLYRPAVYTDAEVEAYVRSIYGDKWSLRSRQESPDRPGAEYHYAAGEGESFTVYSVSVPVYRDGTASGRFRKALFDNYFSTVIEKKMEELEDLAEEYREEGGPRLEIETTGEETGAFGARYAFCLYLERPGQIEEAADLLAEMDSLLAFSCGKGKDPYDKMRPETPRVEVFLKPDGWLSEGADAVTGAARRGRDDLIRTGAFIDWKEIGEREEFRISRIRLTDAASSSRLSPDDLEVRLENDYVDAAKTFGKEFYTISPELWSKYPAPVLTLTNVGGHELVSEEGEDLSFRFVYHRRTGTYWMTGLDPCEDYDGNPFGDYPRRGAFAGLVRFLGGSCSAENWSADWRIGTKQWEASQETVRTPENPWAHRDMTIYCNGNRIPLDAVPGVLEGTGATPAGRPYSIRDLIKMLDVRITINQKKMTAVMFRDYAEE